MKEERKTLVLREGSWHTRLYRWWQRTDPRLPVDQPVPGKPRGYRENLCHYWRAVVIWAPLRFFIFAHPGEGDALDFITPATCLFALTALVGFIVALILAPGQVGLFLLMIFGIIAVAFAFLGLIELGDRLGWWDALEPVGRRVGHRIGRAAHWFIFRDYLLAVVFPWSILLVTAFIVVLTLWPLGTLFVTCAIASAVGLIFLATVLGFHVQNQLEERPAKPKKVKVKPDTGPGLGKVTWSYLKAQKHGICPFIELED